MNNLIITTALSLALGLGAASAQQLNNGSNQSTRVADGTVTQQAPAVKARAHGVGTTSAYSRNVGPASSVFGQPESDMGSAASNDAANARAPSAGGMGHGGGAN